MAGSHRLAEASLHPPIHPPTDDPGSWVLLDSRAYISDHENFTTAECHRRDYGQLIKVTFCLEKPPLVSHFCIKCPGLDLRKLAMEPNILASEERLVLLRVPISSATVQLRSDYFIYQASLKKPPSLRLLPNPHPFYFTDNEIGILPRHTRKGVTYILAALHPVSPRKVGVYNLHLFNGEEGIWTSRVVACNPPLQQSNSFRSINKVITIGGKGSSMGWVDLWGGILICDVLCKNMELQYLPFPTPAIRNVLGLGSPKIVRDIVAVRGRVKYFVMYIKVRVDAETPQGWIATTWSSRAEDSWKWHSECTFDVSDAVIDSNNHIELLPIPKDGEEMVSDVVIDSNNHIELLHIPKDETLSLEAASPTLSLEDDDLVCLMAKVDHWGDKAWILAVDMKNQSLKGMAEFGAERTLGLNFFRLQSKISKFLILSSTQDRKVAAKRSRNEVARAAK